MADINPNIKVNIDTSNALASLRALQGEISRLSKELASSSALNAQKAQDFQRHLIDDINATGKFSARIKTIQSSTESFTNSLEKNKLSLGEYFRYGAASTKTFGGMFKNEMGMLDKVARERVKTLQTQFISLGRDANGALQSIAVRPLRLDLNDLATQQAINAQKQQIFNQLLKQGSTNLLNFGKNTQWAGRQLMVGFTIPLSIFGSQASKIFMDLEEQAIRFKRVYGDLFTPPQEANQMIDTLNQLGLEFTKYGVALKDTMSLAADAAAMGKTGADLTAQVAEATRLAVLGEVSQQQALETSISLTNAFGIATEDLASKIDFLNAVENQTVVSIEDLTIAIPKAAPVVQQLGGGVEDLAFFLTAMKEGGINASEGANALKSGIASLINPTGQAADLFMSFGINIRELVRQNAGDAKGMIISVAQALDKLAPQQRAQAIEQMFGKFQFARISTLFQNVIAEGNQASRVLDLMQSSTADLAALSSKELRAVEESTTYRFKGAIEEFKATLAPIGEEFMKLVTPIIEVGTKVLEQFNKMSDGGKQFITGLITVLGAVAPVALMTFGLIANGIANLLKGFSTIRSFFLGLGKDSTTLAGQTEYMTQQQLEAASAAASLEQKHRNLIQTFNAEKSSVLALGNAYYSTASKMTALLNGGNAMPTIFGGKPKGYADGGLISGPGTGTSDSIPAMVSSGEFIMNAKRTKQYLPLLKLMAAGKLPGFASPEGGTLVGSADLTAGRNISSSSAGTIDKLIQKFIKLGNETADITKLLDSFGEDTKITGKALKDAAKALEAEGKFKATGKHGSSAVQMGHLQNTKRILPSGERVMGSRVRAMTPGQNKAMDMAGQSVEDFSRDWNKMTDGLGETIKLGGEELTDEMRLVAREIDKDIHDIAIEMAKARGTLVNDSILNDAADQATLNARAKGGQYAAAADALDRTKDMEVIGRATTQGLKDSEVLRQAGIELGDETYTQLMHKLKAEGLVEFRQNSKGNIDVVTTEKGAGLVHGAGAGARLARQRSDGAIVPQGRRAFDSSYLDMPRELGSYVMDEFGQQLKEEAAVKSPSKKTTQAAKGMVDGVVQTIEGGQDDVRAATQRLVNGVATNVGGRRVTTNQATIDQYTAQKLQGISALMMTGPMAQNILQDDAGSSGARAQMASGAWERFAGIASRATMGLSALTGVVSMFGGQLGEVSGMLFQLSTVAFGAVQVLELLPARFGAGLAKRFLDGLAGFKSASGLFGKLAAGIKGITGLLPGWGWAIAGLAAAIPFVIKLYNDQKNKMEAFGKIVDVTADQIQFLGDQAGQTVVTSTGFQSAVMGASTGANAQQVTDFANNDQFLSNFEQQINAAKAGATESVEEALQLLAYKLSSSGLSEDIVKNVISAIAVAAGRTDLNLDFNMVASPESTKNFIDDIRSQVGQISAAQPATNYLSTGTPYGASMNNMGGSSIDQKYGLQTKQPLDAGIAQQFKDQGAAAATVMEGLVMQLQSGTITLEQYNSQFQELASVMNSIDDESKKSAFADGIISKIQNEDLKKAAESLTTYEQKLALTEMIMSGVVDINQEVIDKLKTESDARAYANSLIAAGNVVREQQIVQQQNDAADAAIAGIAAQSAALEGQINTYQTLIAQGVPAANAYKIVGDAALYTAYQEALAAGKAQEFLAEVEKLMDLTSKYEGFNPVASGGSSQETPFQKAINQLNEQKTASLDTISAYKKLRAAEFDVATAATAAKDATLAAALAQTTVGSKNWDILVAKIRGANAALARTEALMEAIDLATPEGKTAKFMDGYDKAMEAFSAQETKIELQFAIDNKSTQDTITKAQQQIEDINYTLDDYEAGITEIEDQEKGVNEAYDKRIDALDQVSKINSKIAAQQKAQLTIADALSQGDIAAAAAAIQQQRADEASQAIDDQKAALELARQSELDSLVANNGMNRAQLEAEIADLKNQIFRIEEDTLEPAQRALDLATRKKDEDIAALTVAEKTKQEWELLKNKIDIAKTGSAEWTDAMNAALGIVNATVNAWNGIVSKEVTLTVKEERVTGNTGTPTVTPTGNSANSTDGSYAVTSGGQPVINGVAVGGSKPTTVSTAAKIGANIITKNANSEAKTAAVLAKVPGMSTVAAAMAKSANSSKADAAMLNRAADAAAAAKATATKKALQTQFSTASLFRKASGGLIKGIGTDVVPGLLTPGEFVMSRPAVRNFGLDRLKAMNSGQNPSDSVYNYSISVNVDTNANPDQIARAVMTQIKQIDSQRIRSNRF